MIPAFDGYYIFLDTTYFILFARCCISVVNLEDDESTGQQSKKTTTIFTPKSTGNNINSEYLYVFFAILIFK